MIELQKKGHNEGSCNTAIATRLPPAGSVRLIPQTNVLTTFAGEDLEAGIRNNQLETFRKDSYPSTLSQVCHLGSGSVDDTGSNGCAMAEESMKNRP